MTLRLVPAPMNPLWQYDENGEPTDEEKLQIVGRGVCVDLVRQHEKEKGLPPILSTVLDDKIGQELAYAMRLFFHNGKLDTILGSLKRTQRDGLWNAKIASHLRL